MVSPVVAGQDVESRRRIGLVEDEFKINSTLSASWQLVIAIIQPVVSPFPRRSESVAMVSVDTRISVQRIGEGWQGIW